MDADGAVESGGGIGTDFAVDRVGDDEAVFDKGTVRLGLLFVDGGPVAERRVGESGGREEALEDTGEREGLERGGAPCPWPDALLVEAKLPALSALATLRASLRPLDS